MNLDIKIYKSCHFQLFEGFFLFATFFFFPFLALGIRLLPVLPCKLKNKTKQTTITTSKTIPILLLLIPLLDTKTIPYYSGFAY